jgi:predicted deacylase
MRGLTLKQKAIIFGGGAVILIMASLLFLLPDKSQPLTIEEPVTEPEVETPFLSVTTIGTSVQGRDIESYTFGSGDTHLLFVGGMHGGYEWNSVLLAYQMIDHLEANPEILETEQKVTIIPDLNPDGTFLATGKTGRFTLNDISNPSTRLADGRFNANGVDLNRNFDCKWSPQSTWREATVSAGSQAFSEPEAIALRDFVLENTPDAVLFWHSQADNVYASECEEGILPETLALMSTYAKASGYGEVAKFDAYPITGDAEGWLASIGIPAVTVELKGYQTTEWAKNLAGTMAVLEDYKTAK